ncbi:MAG: guanylate kinase [Nitrosomonadales bacterium]|jgi:guanylate kinase
MSQGNLFIISAASGAGKTTLVKELLKIYSNLQVSISHTTRLPRTSEEDGRDYFFIDDNRFDDMIRKHEFLEYAECHGNRYGTSKKAVNDLLENNFDVILEIDWQGANSIRKLYPEAVSIFIMPPSIEDLEKRLKGRNQDSEEVIQSRMKSAIEEISHADEFDYVTINNKIEDTVQELQKIIEQKINKL